MKKLRFLKVKITIAHSIFRTMWWVKTFLLICIGHPPSMFYVLLLWHGLLKKADLHSFQSGCRLTWTLYGIVEKEDDPCPLTAGFVKDFEWLAQRAKKWWEDKDFCSGYKFDHRISPKPITLARIREKEATWNAHCENFWLACD